MTVFPERFKTLLRLAERYTRTDMRYIATNGSWLALGQIASAVIAFGLAVIFGHYATPDAYGNYKYVLAMAGVLGAFSLSGIGTAVTQAVASGKDGALAAGFKLSLRYAFPLVIMAIVASGYEHFVSHNEFLALSFLLIGAFTPFLNALSLFDAFLVGRKDFKRETVYSTLGLLFPAMLIAASLFASERAIVIVAAYFVANTLVAAWFYRKSLVLARNTDTTPAMLGYGTHLSIINAIGTVADRIDSIAIFYFLGPASLGIYAYAIAIPEQIKALIKLVAPLSIAKFASRTLGEIRANIWRRLATLTGAIAAVTLLYVACAPLVFRFLFPMYDASVSYSQLYAPSIILTGVSTVFISALQAHRRTRSLYIANNTGSIFLILVLPVMVYWYGITGAILSQILYRLLVATLSTVQFIMQAKTADAKTD